MKKSPTMQSAATVEIEISLTITETEARALLSLTGYSTKSFLEWFYKHLGMHYLKPHQKGIESLFERIKTELPQHIRSAEAARKAFMETK